MDISSEYIDRDDLALSLGIHIRTLDRWHVERRGPPRTLVGRRIIYRTDAVREWLKANEEKTAICTTRRT